MALKTSLTGARVGQALQRHAAWLAVFVALTSVMPRSSAIRETVHQPTNLGLLVEPFQRTMKVLVNTPANLSCRAWSRDGYDNITLEWFFRDKPLTPTNPRGATFEWDEKKVGLSARTRLMIDRVGLEHSGEYKCTVRTVDGTRQWTEHMRVLVMFPPMIDAFREDADVVNFLVPEGENFRVPCNVRGFPDAKVQWLYEGRILPIKEGRVREVFQKIRRDERTPQMFVSGSTLEVLGFNHRDNGIYRCHSVNQAGNATRAVYAVVQEKPVIVATQTVRALLGGNITMAIFRVLGAPPIELSSEHRHLRDGDTAPPRRQITFSATGRYTFATRQEKADILHLRLDMSNVRLSDAGRYRFVIHNRGGHALLHVKLLVYPLRSKRSMNPGAH